MVSDQEIAKGLESVLRQSDPLTFDRVVQELQAKFGLDLSHKTAFIRDHINLLLRSQPSSAPPPPPPPQPQPHSDRFTLHHYPHFQQLPPHYALHAQYHQPIFPQDLNFRQPHAPSQPQPTPKSEAIAHNVSSSELSKESGPVGGKRRGGPGGLIKVCGVTPELQAVVGEPALPRTEIVKQLWAYIRKHNLQDPSNKRKIICDDALRIVFETDCTDMFKMNKLLAKHIIPLEPSRESSQAKRVKVDVEPAAETTESGGSVMAISDALAKFLGDGSREMTRLEASKRVWEHIKANKLEDPVNSAEILCDEKLRELLGCESVSAVGVEEMLTRYHLLKSCCRVSR